MRFWAVGVALWPQAAANGVLGAPGDGRGVAAVVVAADAPVALQALVPAVQGRGQGRASDPNVCPGAAQTGQPSGSKTFSQ